MLITFAVFLFSWCGYGNGLSFKEIGETDIEYIENFVRNELEKRLLEISERKGKQFDECEKEFFFGIYASSISEFKFLRGERIQILAIADILRQFMDKNGVDALKYQKLVRYNHRLVSCMAKKNGKLSQTKILIRMSCVPICYRN